MNGAPDVPAEHGLAGFQGHIADSLGEVTTDVYGAPLCGARRAALSHVLRRRRRPGVDIVSDGVAPGGTRARPLTRRHDGARRDAADWHPGGTLPAPPIEGKLKIPNVGPNRYALSVTPPDGTGWVQTTTLEGNLDWDTWVMEGATGLDTEFVVAGEPFPAVIFGYVPRPSAEQVPGAAGQRHHQRRRRRGEGLRPDQGRRGGLPGTIWGGLAGAKVDGPIADPWVTLTDLGNGDTAVWVGRATPTAPSPSRTSPTATTRSPGGTSR